MSYDDLNFIDKIISEIKEYTEKLSISKTLVLEIIEDAVHDMIECFEGGHHG